MKDFLNYAVRIGEGMLLSGAEVHRVEDCIERICRARGAIRTDVFIITSSMVVSVTDASGKIHTQTRRICAAGTDYTKLDALNALCRRICSENMTNAELDGALSAIGEGRRYSFPLQILAYALAAAAFTVFFGGTPIQMLFGGLIGACVRLVVAFSERAVKNTVFTKFLCSFFVAAATFLVVLLEFAHRTDEMIIGNIMLLVPGLGFTNALRDLFAGDSIAGSLRLLEALLSAVAIAAGYFLLVFLVGGAV